ncbi:MAG: valine--tRNA ligase [Candidatus Zixiibacteriota bacterium]
MAKELVSRYEASELEERWYREWEEAGVFTPPAVPESEKGVFSVVIPPPNVTGSLHMGHALNNTIQDIYVRQRRMAGYDTLWLPGTDHASIATHTVIERELAKEGVSRRELGREEFLRRAWAWKEQYGDTIVGQLKRLGCSCDWTRLRFTMDEGLTRAVREAFVRYWEDGLLYRGLRMVNWCPRCRTALSDLEVRHEETDGMLWYIRYPAPDGGPGIVVATTRPETMLGDTAVAVNPADERYRDLIGKAVVLPLVEREIPVIADEAVDSSFGTGAVKITPAHDADDYEVSQRHDLRVIVAIDEDARMTDKVPEKYRGMSREEAREAVLKDLQVEGLLETTKAYKIPLAKCDRCKTVVEPYLSLQWFVKQTELARPAREAVAEGRVRLVPERWTKVFFDWMDNVHDWCVSRQLWWGHRIPAWYCDDCDEVIVARETPQKCACGSTNIRQDEDVLDTWFSSALWPISTMGWPDETGDLKHYFPTDLLCTGPDIIFLWVARMIFSSLKFTGEVPFHTVFFHPMIQTAEGKRMSKSLGTGQDPLSLIDRHGADAVRFTLTSLCTQSQSFRLWEERFDLGRNLTNKIWNAARFLLPYVERMESRDLPAEGDLELVDRWILSRLERARARADRELEEMRFNDHTQTLYQFFWSEYCDWYLEAIKPRLYGKAPGGDVATRVARYVFDVLLRLFHPTMPYVTEELYHLVAPGAGFCARAPWPGEEGGRLDDEAEGRIGELFDVVRAVRNIRAEMNVPPASMVDILISSEEAGAAAAAAEESRPFFELARISSASPVAAGKRPAHAAAAVAGTWTVFVPLEGLIDFDVEKGRLEKSKKKLEGDIETLSRKLSDENFVKKAPPEVVAADADRLETLRATLSRVADNLAALE